MAKYTALILLAICFIPTLSQASIDPGLPDLGEPYEQEVEFRNVRSAFFRGNYELAFNLSLQLLYQKARQQFVDEKNLAVNVTKLAKKLQDIINNPNKTTEEKGEEVAAVILQSLEPYEYTKTDAMNPTLKHSIEYGATFIHWDAKTRTKNCSGYFGTLTFQEDCSSGICDDVITPGFEYRRAYLVQVPDYYIYRVIGGRQELITKINGYRHVNSYNYYLSLDDGWFDLLKTAVNYYRDIPGANIEEDRLLWLDLHSDIRDPGESLSYKIVADNSNYKLGNCGHSNQWVSTIQADADGDGKMDFIPEHEYQKFFGKYYAWLVPVITYN